MTMAPLSKTYLLTYLLFLKERGFLNASLGCAIEIVLSSLDVRLESPNALWRLFKFHHNT
jgi:hypothetical protein